MLPLMYQLVIRDIIFCVSTLKSPQDHFDISKFVSFSSSSTRSGDKNKMTSHLNLQKHYYFNRLPRLWNALPPLDLSTSTTYIKRNLSEFLRDHSRRHWPCMFHFLCPCAKCSHSPPLPSFKLYSR